MFWTRKTELAIAFQLGFGLNLDKVHQLQTINVIFI